MMHIEVLCHEDKLPADASRVESAVKSVLSQAGITQARVNVAIVDDAQIQTLNRQYLDHDYPTDVLSFRLSADQTEPLEGEIVISGETAHRQASRYGWRPEEELLLYVVHGALHLVGYDDVDDRQRGRMRAAEREILGQFGLSPRYDENCQNSSV